MKTLADTLIALLCLHLLFLSTAQAALDKPWELSLPSQEIRFCGDKAGWPPYTYEDHGLVKGYDRDLLEEVFAASTHTFSIQMLPWKRCLQMVIEGSMDVALSASGTEERRTTFRMTEPYYLLTPSYIYLKSRFAEGVNTAPGEVTQQYKVCGLRGYSYHSFGIPVDKIDTNTSTFFQLFNKTAAGRCDLLLGRVEVIKGFALINNPLLTNQWQHTPIPGIEADDFRMLVSRGSPHSLPLYQFLNTRILKLKQLGVLDRLIAPYMSPEPHRK